MSFFWKVYFTMTILVMSCFSLGNYHLINSDFESSLNYEIQQSYQENDFVSQVLDENYQEIIRVKDSKKNLYMFFQNVIIRNFAKKLSICIRDKEGQIIYLNDNFQNNQTLIKEIGQDNQAYQIKKENNHYYLHTIKPYLDGNYIENMREITFLFQNRTQQYQGFFYTSCILLVSCMIGIYFLTKWLISPIQKLSLTTKNIAENQMFEYIEIKGTDEFAQLTENFNMMLKRLEQSMKEMKEVNEKQTLFISHFTHELKTPLTAIIGFGDTIRSKRITEEEQINYANHIVKEGKRLESLSMKLMDLIVLKKQDYKLQFIFVPQFMEYIEKSIDTMMKKANIHYEIKVEEGYIYAEPDLMITAILNLLDNAKKAIQNDEYIMINGYQSQNHYVLEIIDNGCGMDNDELSKIKEPFYMVDKSRSRSYNGAGLGLSLVDAIMKVHHAQLIFESEKNKGTTVKIIFEEIGHDGI